MRPTTKTTTAILLLLVAVAAHLAPVVNCAKTYETMEACIALLSSNMKRVSAPKAVEQFHETVARTLPGVSFEDYQTIEDEHTQLLRMDYPEEECMSFMDEVEVSEDVFQEAAGPCNDMFEADEAKFLGLIKADPVLSLVMPQREACFNFVPTYSQQQQKRTDH